MSAAQWILRVGSGLLGIAFALLAGILPIVAILNFYDEGLVNEHGKRWPLGLIGYWLTILSFVVFCVLVAAVLLRFARRGHSKSVLKG